MLQRAIDKRREKKAAKGKEHLTVACLQINQRLRYVYRMRLQRAFLLWRERTQKDDPYFVKPVKKRTSNASRQDSKSPALAVVTPSPRGSLISPLGAKLSLSLSPNLSVSTVSSSSSTSNHSVIQQVGIPAAYNRAHDELVDEVLEQHGKHNYQVVQETSRRPLFEKTEKNKKQSTEADVDAGNRLSVGEENERNSGVARRGSRRGSTVFLDIDLIQLQMQEEAGDLTSEQAELLSRGVALEQRRKFVRSRFQKVVKKLIELAKNQSTRNKDDVKEEKIGAFDPDGNIDSNTSKIEGTRVHRRKIQTLPGNITVDLVPDVSPSTSSTVEATTAGALAPPPSHKRKISSLADENFANLAIFENDNAPPRLFDYFVVFGVDREKIGDVLHNMKVSQSGQSITDSSSSSRLRLKTSSPGSVSSSSATEAKRYVDGVHVDRSLLVLWDRVPRVDHDKKNRVDVNWCHFAYPSGVMLSSSPRPLRYYATVMTSEDGTQLFATYLVYDVQLTLPPNPNRKKAKEAARAVKSSGDRRVSSSGSEDKAIAILGKGSSTKHTSSSEETKSPVKKELKAQKPLTVATGSGKKEKKEEFAAPHGFIKDDEDIVVATAAAAAAKAKEMGGKSKPDEEKPGLLKRLSLYALEKKKEVDKLITEFDNAIADDVEAAIEEQQKQRKMEEEEEKLRRDAALSNPNARRASRSNSLSGSVHGTPGSDEKKDHVVTPLPVENSELSRVTSAQDAISELRKSINTPKAKERKSVASPGSQKSDIVKSLSESVIEEHDEKREDSKESPGKVSAKKRLSILFKGKKSDSKDENEGKYSKDTKRKSDSKDGKKIEKNGDPDVKCTEHQFLFGTVCELCGYDNAKDPDYKPVDKEKEARKTAISEAETPKAAHPSAIFGFSSEKIGDKALATAVGSPVATRDPNRPKSHTVSADKTASTSKRPVTAMVNPTLNSPTLSRNRSNSVSQKLQPPSKKSSGKRATIGSSESSNFSASLVAGFSADVEKTSEPSWPPKSPGHKKTASASHTLSTSSPKPEAKKRVSVAKPKPIDGLQVPNKRAVVYYAPVTICLVSHYPHIPLSKQCLSKIYDMSLEVCKHALITTTSTMVRQLVSSSKSRSSKPPSLKSSNSSLSLTSIVSSTSSLSTKRDSVSSVISIIGDEDERESSTAGFATSAGRTVPPPLPDRKIPMPGSTKKSELEAVQLTPSSPSSMKALPTDDPIDYDEQVAPLPSALIPVDNKYENVYEFKHRYEVDPQGYLERYIQYLVCEIPLPISGRVHVQFSLSSPTSGLSDPVMYYNQSNVFTVRAPVVKPFFMSQYSLVPLMDLLGVDNLVTIFTAMLTEERILFHSMSYSTVTTVMQTFVQLFYPMRWWYAFIPCLTDGMLDAHEIPQPYMLGMHSDHLEQCQDLAGVIIIDCDHGVVDLGKEVQLSGLPLKEGLDLWRRLRNAVEDRAQARDSVATHTVKAALGSDCIVETSHDKSGREVLSNTDQRFDFMVYEAILRFYADILRGYRNFLFFVQEVPYFNRTGFLATRTDGKVVSASLTNTKTNGKKVGEHNLHQTLNVKRLEADPFYKKFVDSRAFDVYLEQEKTNNPFHDYIAGTVSARYMHELLLQEYTGSKKRRVFFVPPPLPLSAIELNHLLELEKQQKKADAAILLDGKAGSPEVDKKLLREKTHDSNNQSADSLKANDEVQLPPDAPTAPRLQPFTFKLRDRFFHQPRRFPIPAESLLPRFGSTPRNNKTTAQSVSPFSPHASPLRSKNNLGVDDNDLGSPDATSGFIGVSPSIENTPQSSPVRRQLELNGGNSPTKLSISLSDVNAAREDNRVGSNPSSPESTKFAIRVLPPTEPSSPRSLEKEKVEETVVELTLEEKREKKRLEQRVVRVNELVGAIFSSTSLTQDEYMELSRMLSDSSVRTRIMNIMNLSQPVKNNKNGAVCLSQASFSWMSKLLRALLDCCSVYNDHINATAVLSIRNAFYSEDINGFYQYIDNEVKTHPFWRNIRYWKRSLAYAIEQKEEEGGFATADLFNEYVLSWMIAAAHQMLSTGLDKNVVSRCMKELAVGYDLKSSYQQTLNNFLEKMSLAISSWNVKL